MTKSLSVVQPKCPPSHFLQRRRFPADLAWIISPWSQVYVTQGQEIRHKPQLKSPLYEICLLADQEKYG